MENYSLESQFGTGISVVGSEPFLYTAIKNWLTTPEGVLISDISSVAVNASNLVHVFNRGPNPVAIFKQDGSYVNSWGNDILADAHGISINSKGEVYLGEEDRGVAAAAIHDFNDYLTNEPRIEQVLIPLRDGVTLARRVI